MIVFASILLLFSTTDSYSFEPGEVIRKDDQTLIVNGNSGEIRLLNVATLNEIPLNVSGVGNRRKIALSREKDLIVLGSERISAFSLTNAGRLGPEKLLVTGDGWATSHRGTAIIIARMLGGKVNSGPGIGSLHVYIRNTGGRTTYKKIGGPVNSWLLTESEVDGRALVLQRAEYNQKRPGRSRTRNKLMEVRSDGARIHDLPEALATEFLYSMRLLGPKLLFVTATQKAGGQYAFWITVDTGRVIGRVRLPFPVWPELAGIDVIKADNEFRVAVHDGIGNLMFLAVKDSKLSTTFVGKAQRVESDGGLAGAWLTPTRYVLLGTRGLANVAPAKKQVSPWKPIRWSDPYEGGR